MGKKPSICDEGKPNWVKTQIKTSCMYNNNKTTTHKKSNSPALPPFAPLSEIYLSREITSNPLYEGGWEGTEKSSHKRRFCNWQHARELVYPTNSIDGLLHSRLGLCGIVQVLEVQSKVYFMYRKHCHFRTGFGPRFPTLEGIHIFLGSIIRTAMQHRVW